MLHRLIEFIELSLTSSHRRSRGLRYHYRDETDVFLIINKNYVQLKMIKITASRSSLVVTADHESRSPFPPFRSARAQKRAFPFVIFFEDRSQRARK